ncbi:uncharacterized protein LOC135385188 [Ornithodoros turicata]|uniref:uncharacterized protein LOC135385188 n=1 Tax=Ornithodoros turicata TaxID=34597 RepID=UPI003138C5C3
MPSHDPFYDMSGRDAFFDSTNAWTTNESEKSEDSSDMLSRLRSSKSRKCMFCVWILCALTVISVTLLFGHHVIPSSSQFAGRPSLEAAGDKEPFAEVNIDTPETTMASRATHHIIDEDSSITVTGFFTNLATETRPSMAIGDPQKFTEYETETRPSIIIENSTKFTEYAPETTPSENSSSTTRLTTRRKGRRKHLKKRSSGPAKPLNTYTGASQSTNSATGLSVPCTTAQELRGVDNDTTITASSLNSSSSSLSVGVYSSSSVRTSSEVTALTTLTEVTHPPEATTAVGPVPSSTTLVCTIGRYSTVRTVFPKDGVCSFTFYDSVTMDGRHNFISSRNVAPPDPFRRFLDVANASTLTSYGVSITYRDVEPCYEKLNSTVGEASFKRLWNLRIRHHGILDLPLSDEDSPVSHAESIRFIVLLLMTLKELQHRNGGGTSSYIFVAVSSPYRGDAGPDSDYTWRLNRLLTRAQVDVLIVRTHYTERDGGPNCRMTGSNAWERSYDSKKPSILAGVELLQQIQLPHRVRFFFTFTLAGRIYEAPTKLGPIRSIQNNPCGANAGFHLESVRRGCLSDVTYTWKDIEGVQMWTVHNEGSWVFVYDRNITIRSKMCHVAQSNLLRVPGWAAFDLEFADVDNVCRDRTFTDGFAFLHWMKAFARRSFGPKDRC